MRIQTVASLACLICLSPQSIAKAQEATVALCGKPIPNPSFSVLLPQLEGSVRSLVVATRGTIPKDAECTSVRTGVPINAINWLGAVSTTGLRDESPIALTVREVDDQIVTLEVDNPPAVEVRQLIPRAEILPVRNYQIFGSEERMVAQPDVAAFDVTCHPGKEPAGAILELGTAPPNVSIALQLLVKSTAGFQAQIVRRCDDTKDAGEAVPSGEQASTLSLPIPPASESVLVLSCPQSEGRLRIEKATIRSTVQRPLDSAGAWVWEPMVWRRYPTQLLDAASRFGLGSLFTTVPITKDRVLEPERLADFVGAAHARGIKVIAVEGDPEMIYPAGRIHALERARGLADYNARAAPNSRIDGIQYDIEPYLTPSYGAQTDVVWQLWAETIEQLSEALAQQIEAVVPYWILEAGGGGSALVRASPALNRLIIMAYRTDPGTIISAAAPLLSWSAERGLPATVALESGPVAPERRKVYVKAPEGDLHVIRFDDVAAVVMLDRVRASSTGRIYRLSHTTLSQSGRVSFKGDAEAPFRVAAEISQDLMAWPSFNQFAFHGLPEMSPAALSVRSGSESPP